jgi:hypothetical protein
MYRLLARKPEGKRPLGKPRCRWVDNINTDLGEIGWDDAWSATRPTNCFTTHRHTYAVWKLLFLCLVDDQVKEDETGGVRSTNVEKGTHIRCHESNITHIHMQYGNYYS